MLELLLIAIALVGSLAAGLYDLKTSNIPDKLCILMLILGLIIHSITGFSTGDFSNLINALMFGGLLLVFGLLMYFTGQWGGGDGELIVAIGVLLPNLSIVKTYFPFAISFFINSFFIGAIYSILYSLILSARNPFISKGFFNKIKEPLVAAPLSFFLLLSIISFFYFKYLSFIFFLIFILILFWKFAKSIEQGFYKRISVSKLKVDDMLGEDIPRLKIYKRLIKGLTKEQIKKIKKIKKSVLVREGIRYGLVFFLTLIFTLLFGDIFFFYCACDYLIRKGDPMGCALA
jgi:Flp pilus assembly protein protease CpaA